jgi:glutaredoxin
MIRHMNRRLRSSLVLALLVAGAGATAFGVREHERSRLGERTAASAKVGDIEMYSATTCGICKDAKRWFASHEIPVQSCEIDRDQDCARRFRALGGKGTPLFVVRGERQLGFDRERIAWALER